MSSQRSEEVVLNCCLLVIDTNIDDALHMDQAVLTRSLARKRMDLALQQEHRICVLQVDVVI